MSIKIEISEGLFARIQKHAKPFVDLTPASVIERWADHFEGQQQPKYGNSGPPPPPAFEASGKRYDPLTPPDLLHTRSRGTFGVAPFQNWNDLVRIAHVHAFAKAQTFETLRTVTHAQIRKGNHSGDSGYHFVEEIGISVQGVDANHAWPYALCLAQYLKVRLRASIEWRRNEKAASPGETGIIEWIP